MPCAPHRLIDRLSGKPVSGRLVEIVGNFGWIVEDADVPGDVWTTDFVVENRRGVERTSGSDVVGLPVELVTMSGSTGCAKLTVSGSDGVVVVSGVVETVVVGGRVVDVVVAAGEVDLVVVLDEAVEVLGVSVVVGETVVAVVEVIGAVVVRGLRDPEVRFVVLVWHISSSSPGISINIARTVEIHGEQRKRWSEAFRIRIKHLTPSKVNGVHDSML